MTAKSTADKYWSLIVRARGACERCGDTSSRKEAAHLIRRRFVGDPDGISLRTNLDNGVCLCANPCHRIVDEDPIQMTALVESTIGLPKYLELMSVKNGRHRGWRESDWVRERDRLREIWKELA